MVAIVLIGGKHLLNPLTLVAKEPFLFWLTLWLKSQGASHIVYSASHQHADKITAFTQHLANVFPSLCLDVITEARPLGTGGGSALCAQRFPSEYTLIVNGDSILLSDIRPAFATLNQNPSLDGIIFGANLTNAGRFGTLEVDERQQLCAFREKQPGKGSVNAGVYLLKNELLANVSPDKESSLEYDCFPRWLAEGKSFKVVDDHAPFIDIGTPESLKRAHEQVEEYQSLLMGKQNARVA
ncbi:MAG: sugar phosphate nucleotidyltransferase [Candidatus Berkiella sp.]